MNTTCEICGLPLKRNAQRFCSRKCYGLANRTHAERNCFYCGKKFYSRRERNNHFCSPTCFHEHRKIKRLKVQCQTCDKSFFVSPSKINAKFCSRKCQNQGFIKKIIRTCAVCGNLFETWPSMLKKGWGKFCSRECYGIANSGESNIQWRGGYQEYYGPNWNRQRRRARRKANRACEQCGISEDLLGRALDIHHIKPFRAFNCKPGQNNNYKLANRLENLVALCPSCHHTVEHRIRENIIKIARRRVARTQPPLFVMSQPEQLEPLAEPEAADA